jgi:hypothetical protein
MLAMAIFLLGGCAGLVTGTVSTAYNPQPENDNTFAVIINDNMSLTEQFLTAHIEKK